MYIRVIQKNKSFYFSSGQPLILFLIVKEINNSGQISKKKKKLEGANRGQSFVWEIYGGLFHVNTWDVHRSMSWIFFSF